MQSEAQFDRRTADLLDALDRAGANEERPSNALYAQTLALQTRLLLEPEDTDVLLRNLKSTIERAQPLVGYPFDTTAELVREMAPAFGHSTAYDDLFESVVAIAGRAQRRRYMQRACFLAAASNYCRRASTWRRFAISGVD